jgi:uncharacterized membrane protein
MPETNKSLTAPRQEARTVWLYAVAALLSLVGLADAIYLTVAHVTGAYVQCTVIAGCSEVLGSSYAQIGRVPLAALGAVAYFMAFSLSTIAAFGYKLAPPFLTVVVAAMFLVTLWLLYLQAFVIRAFCQFCLLSAAVTVGLAVTVLIASRLASVKRRG